MARLESTTVVVAAIGISFVTGFFVARIESRQAPGKADFAPVVRNQEARPRVSSAVRQDERANLPDRDISAGSVALQRLKTIAELNSTLSNKFGVPLLNGEELNGDFVKAFDLTSDETKRLRNQIAAARHQMAELAAAHAEMRSLGAEKFLITIPPFPAEGGKVYDRLIDSIRTVLGAERYQSFEALSDPSVTLGGDFSRFGLSDSVFEVQPTVNAQGLPIGSWGSSSGPNPMITYVTGRLDLTIMKSTMPLIYQRMIDKGLVRPTP